MYNKEIISLREEFLKKYCKRMGWDHNNLSTDQYLLITNQEGYLNPNKK